MDKIVIGGLTYPKYCPRGDGEPDCENCPDWNGWICTYPKGD